ncbi:uncharacterized protein [Henckelia pumila]|uniref:uncharacterized protein n=1 Tax=Henckelia pumila TaxID=405737 RepID=UPI003C6DC22A
MVNTINGSLSSEFAKFQRQLVTDYLAWQAAIVREYKRPDQFITQNFDLEWHGYSFGIQPDVDHFAAAKALDIAGLLSHDFEPNPVYDEAKTIGKDFDRLSSKLINLKKKNDVAILFSNEALTAFKAFGFWLEHGPVIMMYYVSFYDGLYHMNVSCDFVDPTSKNIEDYKLLVVPLLYAAPDSLLKRLNAYVKNGGHIIYTCKSGFADENVKVRTTHQPGIIDEACGIYYSQFTEPSNASLKVDNWNLKPEDKKLNTWMELITPTTAKVLAYYDHPVWGKYAAITQN